MQLCWWCNKPCETCDDYQQLCPECQRHIDEEVREFDAIERKWALERNESLEAMIEDENR